MGQERTYKVRIGIYTTSNGRAACVDLGQGVQEKMNTPYCYLQRMNDRLAFRPSATKTRRGVVSVSNDKIQFGTPEDVERLQDFAGEYNTIRWTQSGMLIIVLCDKTGYTRTTAPKLGTPSPNPPRKAQPKPQETPTSLAEMLEAAISDTQDRRQALTDRLTEIEQERRRVVDAISAADTELAAYRAALTAAKGAHHE